MPTQLRISSALALHHPSACCPWLNSTAQPWPLPGHNHSAGTAMFNSALTTKPLSHFLTGKADEPHVPFQGTESMFTATREAIDWHIRALFSWSPLILFQLGKASRLGVWSKSRAPKSGGEDGHEMPAGPRGKQVQSWEQLLVLLTFIQCSCVYKYWWFLSATLWFPGSYWISEIIWFP